MTEEAKAARREYKRNYARANAERINAYQRNWRKANPEKVKTYNQSYWSKKAEEGAGNDRETMEKDN